MIVFDRVKEVVCFGEGAGANILTRFAVSIISNTITTQYTRHSTPTETVIIRTS